MVNDNNYDDLEYIDPEEDRESDFLDEEEYDDNPENIQDAFENIKQKVEKTIGIDGRENFDSTSDHVAYHVPYNGVFGVVRGAFLATVALLSEAIHVIWSNLTGGHAHFSMQRALASARGIEELKDDRKEKAKEDKNPVKDSNEKEKANEDKEKEKAESPEKKDTSYDINDKIFQQTQKNMESPEMVNGVIDICLNSNSVLDIFKELDVQPVNTHDSNSIHLFSEKTEMNMKQILCMKKEDFLKGNAESLAAALYKYHAPDNSMESKVSAALQAVIAQAKIRGELNANILNESKEDSKTRLSEIYFQTDKLDTVHMYLEISNDPEQTKLYYQNKEIGTVNLKEPIQKQLEYLQKQTMEQHKNTPLRLFTMHHENKTLSFAKKGTDLVTIRCGKNFDSLNLREEKDLKEFSQFLQKQYGFPEAKANASAMVVAMNAFPMLPKSVDSFGYELNPFTEEKKRTGDVFINRDPQTHNISTYGVELIDGKVKENISIIALQENCSTQKTNIDSMVSSVEQCFGIEKKENTLDDMVLPMEASSKEPILDNPDWSDGKKAFQQLKERSVLDNLDISKIQFKDEQVHSRAKSSPEKERASEKQNFFHDKHIDSTEDVELNEEELAAFRESEPMYQATFEIPECDENEL